MTISAVPQQAHLSLDSDAFAEKIEPFRRELQAHCYRMLGNVGDAEDLAQETLTRAWQKRDLFEGRGTLRAWLYKIATNACLNALRQRPRRTLPVANGAAAHAEEAIPSAIHEPVWLEPYPDHLLPDTPEDSVLRGESIALAFMTVLHRLPARQRAVLLLSDVLEWPAKEIAQALDMSLLAVKSALRRARQTIKNTGAEVSATAQLPSGEALTTLLDRYVSAWQRADIDGLVSMLRDDATFSMPPIPVWYRGPADIRWLISRTIFAGAPTRRWHLLPTRASNRLAFGLYKLDETSGRYKAYGIQVLTLDSDRIADITTCINASLAPRFGLPDDTAL